MNHPDGGQHVPGKLVLKEVVGQGQDRADLVRRKVEP